MNPMPRKRRRKGAEKKRSKTKATSKMKKTLVEISELIWDDIKKYCKAYWYENEEVRGFKKYNINVYADKKPQLQSYPAWPIPKGAW
jgi:hypothetical protein